MNQVQNKQGEMVRMLTLFVLWNFLPKSIVDAKSFQTCLGSRGNYIKEKNEAY